MRAVSPLMRALVDQGWDGRIVTTEAALPVVQRQGFESDRILIIGRTPIDADALFLHDRPRLFVAGIAEWTEAERRWLSAARRHAIPSLGLLDAWGEYETRIATTSVAAGEYTDCLGVVNEHTRARLSRECSWPRIVATGNPGLEEFLTVAADAEAGARARTTLSLPQSGEVVSFFSQPIAQKLAVSIGYTQYDALLAVARHVSPSQTLLVAAHPLEDVAALERTIDHAPRERVRILTDYDPKVVFAASDLVASCFSTALVQAALALRPTVSIQPGLRGRNRCWSADAGVSELAVTEGEVGPAIARAIAAGRSSDELRRRRDLIDVQPGATTRLVAIAAELAEKVHAANGTTGV